ncbi:hypothetical protein AB0F36_31850 [Streptomyces sp. NPDC029080]|uniref:hypothetical protein n=1 Tax=Streptomyces sp. NPDC029080 TaxID=3155017 RepID=UPI0033CD7A28
MQPGRRWLRLAGRGDEHVGDAADELEGVSSGIRGLIRVKGKTSDTRATVTECADKDPDRYFRVLHPWSLHVIQMVEDNPALLSLGVISGCCQVPGGRKAEYL